MINQYCEGAIPAVTLRAAIPKLAAETIQSAHRLLRGARILEGSRTIWALLSATDKFIGRTGALALAKQPDSRAQLDATLYTAARCSASQPSCSRRCCPKPRPRSGGCWE